MEVGICFIENVRLSNVSQWLRDLPGVYLDLHISPQQYTEVGA
jgi:hypothetical protein